MKKIFIILFISGLISQEIFFDDMENGLDNWQFSGDGGMSLSSGEFYSPNLSLQTFFDGENEYYQSIVSSQTINLTNATSAHITFWVRTDWWNPILETFDLLLVTMSDNHTYYLDGYGDEFEEWTYFNVDLSDYVNNIVQIKFRNNFYNWGYMWIDDVTIYWIIPGCTDPIALNYNDEANADDGSCEYYSGPVWHVATYGSNEIGFGTEGNPFSSIQYGVDSSANGDTVLVQPGIYVENINFNGHNITLGSLFIMTGDTSYISQTVIDGNQSGSVVKFISGETSSCKLTGVTVRNGNASGEWPVGYGGGLNISNSSPILEYLVIDSNSSEQFGGGIILFENASPQINNSIIFNNNSDSDGGGIACHSSILNLNEVIITGNTSFSGGGMYITDCLSDIENVIIKNNQTIDSGYSFGGGIIDISGESHYRNVLIANNFAGGRGGSIFLTSQSNFENLTVYGNVSNSYDYSGIYFDSPVSAIFNNSIIWNDSVQPDQEFSGSIENLEVNYSNISGDWLGEENISSDPLFTDLLNDDFTLQPSSPCIDMGNPDLNGDGITWENDPDDQDPDGTRMDMGAYYFHQLNGCIDPLALNYDPEVIVDDGSCIYYEGPKWHISTIGSDDNNGSLESPFFTIQHGIDVSVDGDTVLVHPGSYYESIDGFNKNISIGSLTMTTGDTSYISQTIIDFENILDNGQALIISCKNLDGFTIQNNETTNSERTIYCHDDCIYQNLVIQNNAGSPIYAASGNLQVYDSVIKNNSLLGPGSGIAVWTNANVFIENVQIINNISTEGGAFHISGNSYVTINNSLVVGNYADGRGGAIMVYGSGGASTIEINNSTIANNNSGGNHEQGIQADIYEYHPSDTPISEFIINSSIIWDDNISSSDWYEEDLNLDYFTITYSDIDGGWSGIGNINDDPLFSGAEIGDYTLQNNSPCIDAGDPNSDFDPDGTNVDMGAYYFNQIFGCTDLTALNFNPGANVDDGTCLYAGCTDLLAINFNPEAIEDDGSCIYLEDVEPHFTPVWSGVPINPMGIYIQSATFDEINLRIGDEIGVFDGNVCVGTVQLQSEITNTVQIIISANNPDTPEADGFISGHTIHYRYWDASEQIEVVNVNHTLLGGTNIFTPLGYSDVELFVTTVLGCTDIESFNFMPDATVDDGSCIPFIYGCSDPEACNYDPEANVEGDCVYFDCVGICNGEAYEDECGICDDVTENDCIDFDPQVTLFLSNLAEGHVVDLTFTVSQNPYEPDMATTLLTSDGGAFGIASMEVGEEVGFGNITIAGGAVSYEVVLVIVEIISWDEANIVMSSTDGTPLGGFVLSNTDIGVSLYAESPGDDNIITAGNNSTITFDGIFLTPLAGSLTFYSTITSELGDLSEAQFEFEIEPVDCAGVINGGATVDDCGVCDDDPTNDNECYGCTDIWAMNYDPDNLFDDGSCVYPGIGDISMDGQINVVDIVYLVDVVLDGGVFISYMDLNNDGYLNIIDIVILVDIILNPENFGCTDPNSPDYNPDAIFEDGSCGDSFDYSLYFNGTNDFISFLNSTIYDIIDELTVSVWISPSELKMASIIDRFPHSGSVGYRLITRTNGEIWTQFGSGLDDEEAMTIPNFYNTNEWINVTGVYKNSNYIKLYINGILINTTNTTKIFNTTEPIEFGRWNTTLNIPIDLEYFHGYMDDVSIWNTALSQSEIQANMNTTLIGNESDLIGYWNFNDGSGDTLHDLSVNNNNGIIHGAIWSNNIPVLGCTDPDALNFNPDANVGDNSCEYEEGTCVDIDGNSYETVQIGTQLWMAENLKTTHYNNGDPIPTGWPSYDGAYAVYNNDPSNADIYGNLYNWYAVDDTRDICPEGWHVPTDAEWAELTDYLGGESVAGGKMKSTGTLENGDGLWYSPNAGATNESGFTALPGGYRYGYDGLYYSIGGSGHFWSSTAYDSYSAWRRSLYYYYSSGHRYYYDKQFGLSVRCLKDAD